MTRQDETRLIQAILNGNSAAFRGLVEEYSPALYRFCRLRLGDDDDAEDALQDVFVRAYQALANFDQNRSFAAWLFGIAANQVKALYRQRQRTGELLKLAGTEAMSQEQLPEFSDELIAQQAVLELRRALGTLPRKYREPLELFYFAGLSVQEGAAAMKIGTEAFKSRLLRGRRRLGTIIEEKLQPAGLAKDIH
ncbi:MAG: RNA polymerase sigma factor [Spirochaetes bacterium]|nr:RNA polymerase sigma factor [Spirochaetota bacterium]MBU0955577.1 RNA polymerase sigma factor [Spirochaetota bacterium]